MQNQQLLKSEKEKEITEFKRAQAAKLAQEQEEDDLIKDLIAENLDEIKDYLPKDFFAGPQDKFTDIYRQRDPLR